MLNKQNTKGATPTAAFTNIGQVRTLNQQSNRHYVTVLSNCLSGQLIRGSINRLLCENNKNNVSRFHCASSSSSPSTIVVICSAGCGDLFDSCYTNKTSQKRLAELTELFCRAQNVLWVRNCEHEYECDCEWEYDSGYSLLLSILFCMSLMNPFGCCNYELFRVIHSAMDWPSKGGAGEVECGRVCSPLGLLESRMQLGNKQFIVVASKVNSKQTFNSK